MDDVAMASDDTNLIPKEPNEVSGWLTLKVNVVSCLVTGFYRG